MCVCSVRVYAYVCVRMCVHVRVCVATGSTSRAVHIPVMLPSLSFIPSPLTFLFALLFGLFVLWSHIALAGFELPTEQRIRLHSSSSCPHPPSSGVAPHQASFVSFFISSQTLAVSPRLALTSLLLRLLEIAISLPQPSGGLDSRPMPPVPTNTSFSVMCALSGSQLFFFLLP